MNALGDCAQTVRPMINRIHRCDHREKHLRRADVTRRFVAADVLLARLQREAIAGPPVGIVRNADEPSRHVPFVCIARREIGGVRSAETERNAEALRVADGDIGAEFARRLQQRERQNIRRDDDERAGFVRCLAKICVIENRAVGRGILHERAENGVVELEVRENRQRRPRCRAASRAFARPRSFADGNCSRRRKFPRPETTA